MSKSKASLLEMAHVPQTRGQERGRDRTRVGDQQDPRPGHQRFQRRSDKHKTELQGNYFHLKQKYLTFSLCSGELLQANEPVSYRLLKYQDSSSETSSIPLTWGHTTQIPPPVVDTEMHQPDQPPMGLVAPAPMSVGFTEPKVMPTCMGPLPSQ